MVNGKKAIIGHRAVLPDIHCKRCTRTKKSWKQITIISRWFIHKGKKKKQPVFALTVGGLSRHYYRVSQMHEQGGRRAWKTLQVHTHNGITNVLGSFP